jgi:DNA-binding IclR family transcriptional regulator
MDRALAVLDSVVARATPLSVTDIAEACRLPVPTAHRLVMQLEKRGLLKRALDSKKVIVGEALLRLGLAALDAALRGDRPHQILLTLSATLGEHVQVGIRADNDVLYVDTAHVPESGPGLQFVQGRRAPLYCTSIGKIFLAEMPADEFARWLAQMPLPAMTPRTITTRHKLRAAVGQGHRMGGERRGIRRRRARLRGADPPPRGAAHRRARAVSAERAHAARAVRAIPPEDGGRGPGDRGGDPALNAKSPPGQPLSS